MTILVDIFAKFNLSRDRVLLLLSDAAPYMKLAGKKCNPFFENMSHIFCFAHLLHNVIGELISHYKNTNFLIASIKASVVKKITL